MIIKILGGGCPNCKRLEANTILALKEANIEAEIVKVTEYPEIMKYNVMSTPALVVDEVVVSSGRILSPKNIIKLLQQ
jgi:small redox-active disulfide protein 2